jgi:hypothetical protein
MMGPGQARPFIEDDFVGRDEPMANLLKVARQETPKRILLVLGPFGIGKSWLLQKLQADRDESDIESVLVDFATPPLGRAEWGYLDIVEASCAQLGGAEFEALRGLIETVRKEGAGLGLADPFATQMAAAAPAAAAPAAPSDSRGGDTITVQAGDIGMGAQVAIGSNIVMAQGDVHYHVVNQVGQNSDQAVQQHYQARITEAFRESLAAFSATRKVSFVFDAWLKASNPTRDWLFQTLLAWIRDKQIAGAAAIVSDDAAVPELQGRHPLVHPMELSTMTEAEIHDYWVDKRGLGEEKVVWVAQACLGHPLTLAMIADLHEMQGGL